MMTNLKDNLTTEKAKNRWLRGKYKNDWRKDLRFIFVIRKRRWQGSVEGHEKKRKYD